MQKNQHEITVSVFLTSAQRIDQYLTDLFPYSRQQIKTMIKGGQVRLNGNDVKPSQLVSLYDRIEILIFDVPLKVKPQVEFSNMAIRSNDIVIPVIYNDDDLLIINKPFGLVVHDAPTVDDFSLVDYVKAANIPLFSDETGRPGIVHRLDQFTEGLMILAKSASAFFSIRQQFKDRQIEKKYYAVLQGVPRSKAAIIDRPIGRDSKIRARQSCNNYIDGTEKSAITKYKVLRQFTNITVVDVLLVTGRTHQIRVHFSTMNCPVLGDFLYSKQSKKNEGYYLQSYYLKLQHPTKDEPLVVELPISQRLKKYAGDNADA
tara:strand:- start:5341 stop:6291 length:951 start_codon:yes stop_codon:yes gene_type:complete